jgi:hypothetical protein
VQGLQFSAVYLQPSLVLYLELRYDKFPWSMLII